MRGQNKFDSYIPSGLSEGLIEFGFYGLGSLNLPYLRDYAEEDWGKVVSSALIFYKTDFNVVAPDSINPNTNPPVSLINLNYAAINSPGNWNLTGSAIKTNYTYSDNYSSDFANRFDLGNVSLREETSGSTLFLRNTATGAYDRYSSRITFDADGPGLAPGVSTASTSLNYIGRDSNKRIEETIAAKTTENYQMIVGQKPNANGEDIGLNTSRKSIIGTFSYKDGINTSDRSDNVAVTTKSQTVETRSSNLTTTADVLNESYSHYSAKNISLGLGSNDSYSQNESLVRTNSDTQTFNADSSIGETRKSNSQYSSQYSESVSDISDIDVDNNYIEIAQSEYALLRAIVSTDYANSININGDYKETNKTTWDYTFTGNETGIFNGGSYKETISLSNKVSTNYLLDEQLPNSLETLSFNGTVVASYLDEEFYANKILAESIDFKISGTAIGASTNYGNEKNNTQSVAVTITNFSYTEKFDFDNNISTAATNGYNINFVGSASYSGGTDANGINKPDEISVKITSGSLTKVLDNGTVDYSITTKATTLNASYLSVLQDDETLNLQTDLYNLERYLSSFQPDEPKNQDIYIQADYAGVFDTETSSFLNLEVADSLEELILLGDNTITIKNIEGQTVFGGLGADTIIGGDGNDSINGGRGADIINGGKGDDVYIIDRYSGSNFGELGAGKTFQGSDTFTFSDILSNSDRFLINDMFENIMTLSSSLSFKAANFLTVDAVVNYLNLNDGSNEITNNSNAYIYVTDSTAKRGAIYYFESSDLNNTFVSADEIKLLGTTTGDFSTDFVM